MNTRDTLIVTALSTFVAGVVTGILMAPFSGRESRRRIAKGAQESGLWLKDHVHQIEERLDVVEDRLHSLSEEIGSKVREATRAVADQYVPTVPQDEEAWKMDKKEMSKELGRMPGK